MNGSMYEGSYEAQLLGTIDKGIPNTPRRAQLPSQIHVTFGTQLDGLAKISHVTFGTFVRQLVGLAKNSKS